MMVVHSHRPNRSKALTEKQRFPDLKAAMFMKASILSFFFRSETVGSL
jgi:hypothetical protein